MGGGDSTYTFNLADLLRHHGHKVAHFAMQHPQNLPDPNANLFVSHIDFKDLNGHHSAKAGLTVAARAIYSREAKYKFGLLLERFKPDIVHLQNIHAHITPSVIIEARARGIPIVWTLHDYKLICPNSHYLRDATTKICEACGNGAYYQAVLHRCKKNSLLASGMASLEAYAHSILKVRQKVNAFLCPSAFLRHKLITRGFPSERVHHLGLFLPTDSFDYTPSNKGYLLFLGKLDPIKGIYPLLDACRLAAKVRVLLAGKVEEPLSTELGGLLPSNVRYVGLKHGDDLRQLLHGASAVVLPSLSYENQPFSLLEAFACGKPAIASDLGGMTELVGKQERGLLVPAGDVNALAQAMTWVLEHPVDAQKLGQNAYEYVKTEHQADRHYTDLETIYEQVRRGPIDGCRSDFDLSV